MRQQQSNERSLVDEGGLAASHVSMSDNEAVQLARNYFHIDGNVSRFATEKDDTFLLQSHDGTRSILKVANPAEDPAEISCQIELLEHIQRVNPSLPVPRVISNIDQLTHFNYEDHAGQNRQVRMLTYLDGIPLCDTVSSAQEREQVGEILATLRLATADFSHPADSRELAWDIKHLIKLEHLLSEIDDPEQRKQLKLGLERFAMFESQLSKSRSQVVHNDFSKSNIVIKRNSKSFISGIIDFGDAVRTSIAIDVSTALLNQLPSEYNEDIFKEGRDLLRGYLRIADLTEDELGLVPHLVMGRVVARALLTTWRANLFPHNSAYILRNTGQGWAQLNWFLQRPADVVSMSFLEQF